MIKVFTARRQELLHVKFLAPMFILACLISLSGQEVTAQEALRNTSKILDGQILFARQLISTDEKAFIQFTVPEKPQNTDETKIDAKFRGETIDAVLQLLKDKYIYPEIALKMETAIRERQKRGEYDSIMEGNKLAEKITADLRIVFEDKHLQLSYSAKPIPLNSAMAGAPSAEEIAAARIKQTRQNFGLQKVEILKGNIGLMQINYFAPVAWSSKHLTAAMNLLADTDALIIDIRKNGGSQDINAIPFFCSFLFEQPVQVGDFFSGETKETRQLWTYAEVPGRKYLNKPVFLLTGNRTASAAEGFVGHLKRLNRVTTVGETTAGATMPGRSHRVNEHFSIWISIGRSKSGTAQNENKGILPDIPTPLEKALTVAHLTALKQLLETSTDENWKSELKTVLIEVEKSNN